MAMVLGNPRRGTVGGRIMKYWRYYLLISVLILLIVFFFLMDPLKQNLLYHNFADDRSFGIIPSFMDVTSNIFFLLIGLLGLKHCCYHRQAIAPWSWRIMFLGVSLVSIGSAYYHLTPNNSTLVWDRLPMTIAFMGLFVALLTEFVYSKLEKILLLPAILIGMASVVWWAFTDDLRFYLWIQLAPLITIPLVVILFKGPYDGQRFLIYGLLSYVLAKVVEMADKSIYSYTHHLVSGHTIKHLLAAVAIYCIYLMLKKRKAACL